MKPARLLSASLTVALASAGLSLASESMAGEATVFVNWSGAGCNVCGVADYAIPSLSTWNGGMGSFTDPVPAGAVVVQMIATIQGTGDDQITVAVDGTPLGTSGIVGSSGSCDSCFVGSNAASAFYEGGFPGYVPGGTQTVQIVSLQGGIALDGVNVTVVYRVCGDSITDAGEACDQGGDTATCDADCTAVACGDGHVNSAAGESCDASGQTASCDADCTLASCGDGVVNGAAGELCDAAGENAACDDDCTLAECGDGHTNEATGEACDDGNTDDGDGCSSLCQPEGGPTATSTGSGDGGAGPSTSSAGGDAAAGPTGGGADSAGPTANGIAVVAAAGSGGRDDDGDDDDDGAGDGDGDGDGDGGASGDPAAGSSDGCGCVVPARGRPGAGGAFAFALAIAWGLLRRAAASAERGPARR